MIFEVIKLLLLVDLITTFVLVEKLRPGGERMMFVSISYQEQNGTDVHRKTTEIKDSDVSDHVLCQAAIDRVNKTKNIFWKFALEKGKYKVKNVSPNDIEYVKLEFKTHQEAVKIIVELKLNHMYFVDNSTQPVPRWNDLPIKNWNSASKILFVMINCPAEFINVFKDNLLDENYTVIFLNSKFQSKGDSSIDKNLIFSSNTLLENTKELLYHIDTKLLLNRQQRTEQVDSFGIIFLANKEFSRYRFEFEILEKYLFGNAWKLGKCFFTHILDVSDNSSLSDFSNRLHKDNHTKVFVLIGESDEQTLFFKYFYRQLSTFVSMWIVYDLYSTNFPYNAGSSFYAFLGNGIRYSNMDALKKELVDIKHLLGITEKMDLRKWSLMRMCSQAFEDQLLRMIQIIHMNQIFDTFRYFSFKKFKRSCIRRSKVTKRNLRKMFEVYHIDIYETKLYDLQNKAMNLYHTSECPKIRCSKGEEPYFGAIIKNPIWNASYGWTCKACILNTYQPVDAENLTCKPCPEMLKATSDHSICFDPFIYQQYPNPLRWGPIAAIVVCCISLVFTLFTMYVEVKYRSTPFVKASDIRLSMIHLFSKAVMFIAVPFLFLGNLTPSKCLLQPVFLLIFCILPSTLVLKKSQKTLTAFRSKRRLSKYKQNQFSAIEYSMIFFVALISGSILTISFYFKPPLVSEQIDLENREKQYLCNTGDHINIQILLLIFHNLLLTVQAYRERNLPGPFNESMQIVYSTFVAVILYVIVFPMFYLSDDVNVQSSVHLLVIPLSDCLFLVVFYFPRLYVVLGNSGKNTKEYVNRELMKISKQKVDRQLSHL